MTRRDDLTAKLVRALDALGDEQLEALQEVLRDPKSTELFLDLVDKRISLKRAEGRLVGRKQAQQMSHPPLTSLESAERETPEKLIVKLFFDRALFPSTRDVVNAANRYFGLDLKYDDFRKDGRKPLVRRIRQKYGELPAKVRRSRLRRLVDDLNADSEGEEYRTLFKMLVRQ